MKALVIHPDRLIERGEHMKQMLEHIGLDFEFVNEGTDDVKIQSYLNQWMTNGKENMLERVPRVLCTISHFLAYQRLLDEGAEGALILEDDIELHDDFLPQFNRSIEEYRKFYKDKKVLISYEDSSLQFVPRSQRQKGRMLYPGHRDRLSGAYFINDIAAKAILDHLLEEHCDRAIDCYHNLLIQNGFVDYLWCQPALATQGSFTGAFRSALSKKKDCMIVFRWWFKKNYKRLLYWLR
jgi:glycosyl transferase family 25